MLDILRGFLPWILYFVFSDPDRALMGAGLALLALVLFGRRGLVEKKILDCVTLLFFIALLAALWFGDTATVAKYAFVAAGLTLSLTALGSVAIGLPFTLQYARESVPEEHQDSPIFWKINKIISSFWGAVFALQTVFSLLYLDNIGSATLMNEILPNALTIIAVTFTARFPDWYTSRAIGRDGKEA